MGRMRGGSGFLSPPPLFPRFFFPSSFHPLPSFGHASGKESTRPDYVADFLSSFPLSSFFPFSSSLPALQSVGDGADRLFPFLSFFLLSLFLFISPLFSPLFLLSARQATGRWFSLPPFLSPPPPPFLLFLFYVRRKNNSRGAGPPPFFSHPLFPFSSPFSSFDCIVTVNGVAVGFSSSFALFPPFPSGQEDGRHDLLPLFSGLLFFPPPPPANQRVRRDCVLCSFLRSLFSLFPFLLSGNAGGLFFFFFSGSFFPPFFFLSLPRREGDG